MTTAKLSDLIHGIGRRLTGPPDPAAPDADLLARFLAGRDESAFAQLVHRHGPMVFGVCRRVTGDHHLAEDAFQAVFVVLAAKAGSVRPRAALPGWLYAVAYRTALRARTMSHRRQKRETPVGTPPEVGATPADPLETADAAAVLDAELARLPDRLRVAVVLCELEGRSRQDAAKQLGIAEGTLSSRLATARKTLAARLRGRGLAFSAAGLTAVSVPAELMAKAAATCNPGPLPTAVASLSNGVLRTMLAQKLKLVTVAALLLGVAAVAGYSLTAAPPVDDAPPFDPATLPKGPGQLLFQQATTGYMALIDPDGKNERQVDRGAFDPTFPNEARLSPDGKRLAYLVVNTPRKIPQKLHVKAIDETGAGTDLGVECVMFAWSPGSTEIAFSNFDSPPKLVNVATKTVTPLPLPTPEPTPGIVRGALSSIGMRPPTPAGVHIITDWSRDGRHFYTHQQDSPYTSDSVPNIWDRLMTRGGAEYKDLSRPKMLSSVGRLSPDGKQVLFIGGVVPPDRAYADFRSGLWVQDVASGKTTEVEGVPVTGKLGGSCWSPDGARIAYTWWEKPKSVAKPSVETTTEWRFVTCDPDGKNPTIVLSRQVKGHHALSTGSVDWQPAADPPKPVHLVSPPDDVQTTVTGRQRERPVKFGGNLGTYYEGLVVALLGNCSTENDAKVATKERWEKAVEGDHLRVSFAKPRRFAVVGERPAVEADEIVVPISAAQGPDHIFVRTGDTYRAFAKYDHWTCDFIQNRLKSLSVR